MPTFVYKPVKDSYSKIPDPRYPAVWQHTFYIRAADMPTGVPHECNPRDQNPDVGIYRKVTDSFRNTEDLSFHLKNKGITILAKEVTTVDSMLMVDIPEKLGNVDGQNTYRIVTENAAANPNQFVKCMILENIAAALITPVAGGLNTAVQVTQSSIANHAGLMSEVHDSLKDQPYYDWIKFKDNQQNVSAETKDLYQMMWACNPLIFQDTNSAHPSWVCSRAATLQNAFFCMPTGSKEYRAAMVKMAPLLPDLIEMYMYISEIGTRTFPRRRPRLTQDDSAHGRPRALCTENLYESKRSPGKFCDPTELSMAPRLLMRPIYNQIVLSGARSMIAVVNDNLTWSLSPTERFAVLDAAVPKIFSSLVRDLRAAHGDHTVMHAQPGVWDCAYNVTHNEVLTKRLGLESAAE